MCGLWRVVAERGASEAGTYTQQQRVLGVFAASCSRHYSKLDY